MSQLVVSWRCCFFLGWFCRPSLPSPLFLSLSCPPRPASEVAPRMGMFRTTSRPRTPAWPDPDLRDEKKKKKIQHSR